MSQINPLNPVFPKPPANEGAPPFLPAVQAQQMAAQQQAEMQAQQQPAGGLNAPPGGPPKQDPTSEAPATGRPESMKNFNPGPGPVEPQV